MGLRRLLCLLFIIFITNITPAQSAELGAVLGEKLNAKFGEPFYQINSETVNLPKLDGLQSDLKLLLGENFSDTFRGAVGLYSLYQSARDPSYYVRYGPVLQLRTGLFFKNLYFQFEHHEYLIKSSYTETSGTGSNRLRSENRYGIIYSRYDELRNRLILDTYLESFLIPEVSNHDFLTVFRTTLLYKTENLNPFIEVYLKDSPMNFGGKSQDLRLGLHFQPENFISFKISTNVFPNSTTTSSGLLFQLDIFKEGLL